MSQKKLELTKYVVLDSDSNFHVGEAESPEEILKNYLALFGPYAVKVEVYKLFKEYTPSIDFKPLQKESTDA